MSYRTTRLALEKSLTSPTTTIPPEVYEYRYVKLKIRADSVVSELWVYIGRERDYLLIPGLYCNCKVFTLKTIINKTETHCKHQLGVYAAIAMQKYVEVELSIDEAYTVISEVLNKGFTVFLRRKLVARK